MVVVVARAGFIKWHVASRIKCQLGMRKSRCRGMRLASCRQAPPPSYNPLKVLPRNLPWPPPRIPSRPPPNPLRLPAPCPPLPPRRRLRWWLSAKAAPSACAGGRRCFLASIGANNAPSRPATLLTAALPAPPLRCPPPRPRRLGLWLAPAAVACPLLCPLACAPLYPPPRALSLRPTQACSEPHMSLPGPGPLTLVCYLCLWLALRLSSRQASVSTGFLGS